MLVEFSVGNYLSFKEKVTINMVAANPIKEHFDDNVIVTDRLNLLSSAIVYGANASGKSNFLAAMRFMRWFSINSVKEMQVGEEINIHPFRLYRDSMKEPSFFEIIFIYKNVKYRYGFQVNRKEVIAEWLFQTKKIKEYPLFIRKKEKIELSNSFSEGLSLEGKTRNNALFLSVVAQFNGTISVNVLNWFKTFNHISGIMDDDYEAFTVNLLQKKSYKQKILEFLNRADIGINDIKINEFDITEDTLPKDLPVSIKKEILENLKDGKGFQLATVHFTYNGNNEIDKLVNFNFEDDESEGTKKYFRLSGPIIHTLATGSILTIDELDARLHPLLTRIIVKLFNSKETNPKNAQLIVATHDTNLLNADIFRRDQIWFVEKTHVNASDLYSLAEYRLPTGKVRKDASFEKDYIKGRYGAIPYIGNIEELFKDISWLEKQE